MTGRSFFGDTIPAKYYLNGAATSFNFEYYNSYSSPAVGLNVDSSSIIPTPVGMAQYDFVVYRGILPTYDATYDISIDDFYLRFGDYARGGFALSWRGSSETVASNNATNYPDNFCGEFFAVRANSDVSANLANYYGIMYFEQQSGYTFKYRPIYYSFDNGGVLDSLHFSGIVPNSAPGTTNGLIYLVVICPYIGSSMSGEPPAQTTTNTDTSIPSSGTTVVVDVDMTETNSLLGQIKQAILGIVDGIKGLFIPDPEYLEDFKEFFLGTDEEPGFLEDHLGGLYEAVELIDEFIESLLDITPHATFHVPAASIPLAGTNFQVGNWDLSVESEAIPQIVYDGLKSLIDFLATAAFLNMCKYKLEIFLNPDSEVVKEE